eukprot:2066617-Pleurochrysis_carterae.AAC.1
MNAAFSLHCRHMTKECSQEPVLILRGLAGCGKDRYFQGWPSRSDRGATILGGGIPRAAAQAVSHEAVAPLVGGLCENGRKDGGTGGEEHSFHAASVQGMVQAYCDGAHRASGVI